MANQPAEDSARIEDLGKKGLTDTGYPGHNGYMMKTTKCSGCGSISQTWTATWQAAVTVASCSGCAGRVVTAKAPMVWTLEARATMTQFAPARRPV